jgi:hypothetical protein
VFCAYIDDEKRKRKRKMKMKMKKALPIFVIASMILAFIPSVMFANAALTLSLYAKDEVTPVSGGVKGDTVAAIGLAASVPAGTTIELYWDTTTGAWDGVKGLLNSTTAKSSGGYDVWFVVPQATFGTHYVWVKDYLGNVLSATFTIATKVSLSSSSGLVGDSITTSFYGFKGTKELRVVYNNGDIAFAAFPVLTAVNQTLATGDGVTKEWTGTLNTKPIKPGTITVNANFVSMTDAATWGKIGATGSINYVTGAYDIIFAVAPASGKAVTILYTPFDTTGVGAVKYLDTLTTSSVGSATAAETVPTGAATGSFAAFDGNGNYGRKVFAIGAVILVSPTVSTVGSIIHTSGRGFTPAATIVQAGIVLTESSAPTLSATCMIYNPSSGTITVDSGGNFVADVVVPQGVNIDDDYTITVTSSTPQTASKSFEITAKAKSSVTPEFGAQGTSFTVSGTNYPKISGLKLTVDLVNPTTLATLVNIGTATTLADGTFSKSLFVPAYTSGNYKIKAYNTTVNISSTTSFTVGYIVLLLSKTSAPAGCNTVVLTGSGFTPSGAYNITLGSKTIVSSGTASPEGIVSYTMTIPSMAAGLYDVKVFDKNTGISVTTPFTVTYNTQLTLSPSSVPTGFNVTLSGKGFRYGSSSISLVVYNKTAAGLTYAIWSMTTLQGTPGTTMVVNSTGFVNGWWNFNAKAIKLSNGLYYVNATDTNGYKAQATLTIINKVISCVPRKTTFLHGDTISFNIQHSFGNVAPVVNSKITIKDPAGTVVFRGDLLATWVKSGDFYVVPYSSQTAGGNPMVLADDAPLGTWTWKWPDTNGDTIKSGNFTVAASAVSETNAKIDDLSKQVTDLKSSLSGITSAVQSAQTSANAATAAGNAATAAANAATDAAKAATAAAQAAGTKTDSATAAANAAKAAAEGLTTMVYVAIAASVVAALAAIFAVMQITKKIA